MPPPTDGNLKIGLTQRVLFHKGRAYDSLEHLWYVYLKSHTLVPIANRADQDFIELANSIDALVITGGDDSAIRRTTELKLVIETIKQQKPVVGVCHGCFLLTDILGGTVGKIDGHLGTAHQVNYFGETKLVNSFHNLYIEQLQDTATELATDEHGNCEAWIDRRLAIAGVVWHPERMPVPWLPDEINNLLFKETK